MAAATNFQEAYNPLVLKSIGPTVSQLDQKSIGPTDLLNSSMINGNSDKLSRGIQSIGPTVHWYNSPLVRQSVGPTVHCSDSSLVDSPLVRQIY